MIKAVTIIKRKPGMRVESFQTYWRNEHAEVVKRLPGIRAYVQSHPLPAGYRKGGLVCDGIAEVWADDTEAFREMSASDAYAEVVADEAKFIDRATMGFILCDEHVIKGGPAPAGGVKSVEFITRRPEMGVGAFQRYWREVHGPIAAEIPILRRYVQSHPRPGGYAGGRQPPYDGVAITWFDSTDAMRESAKTPAYARIRADEPNFLAPGDPPFIITREHVIVA